MIEFALVLPVLAVFLLGILSVGGVLDRNIRLDQAGRDGARYASRLDPDAHTGYGQGSWAANVAAVVEARSSETGVGSRCVAAVIGQPDGTVVAYHPTTGPGAGGTFADGASGDVCWQTSPGDGVVDGRPYVQVDVKRTAQIELSVAQQTVHLTSRTMMPAEWDGH